MVNKYNFGNIKMHGANVKKKCWFLILRKDVRLKMSDIGRLRKILGPEGEEVRLETTA